MIARALPLLASYIAQVINAFLTSGIFPEPWRESLLVVLKKTAMPFAPRDFRPIALLCFLSKILEKIVHDQIQEYLAVKKILNSRQAGYRRHNSIQTAELQKILRLTEDIRWNIDKHKMTILLLFDFSKAFDTISPGRLLRIMRGWAFQGLSSAGSPLTLMVASKSLYPKRKASPTGYIPIWEFLRV